MGLIDRSLAALLPFVPRFVVGRVARRYIAGDTLAEACTAVADLNRRGMRASLDVLGEYVDRAEQTERYVREVCAALDAIHGHGLEANVSIKPTQFGLALDPELCHANVTRLLERARTHDNWIRLDMEDSPYTTLTLDLHRRLRGEGFTNVGVVLQAYLHRSLDDVAGLADLRPPIRICKGIYRESAEIAWHDRQKIRENFDALCRAAWTAGCVVGVATHDPWCVQAATRAIAELGVPREQYEFQMLLGVCEPLRDALVAAGHPLRVYVPFGPDWYGYCVRRLRENPAIAGHVLRAMFGVGRRPATPAPAPPPAADDAPPPAPTH